DQVKDIIAALDAEAAAARPDAAFASRAAALMRTKSPTSLKIALAQMRRGPSLDFTECMRAEFRIVSRVVRGHDFYEGIRAVVGEGGGGGTGGKGPAAGGGARQARGGEGGRGGGAFRAARKRARPAVMKGDQPHTLEPVHAGEDEAEGRRWAYWLVVFLRVMA